MMLEASEGSGAENELRFKMSKTNNTVSFTAISEAYDGRWSAKVVPEARVEDE
jgi:hypothetical protein